MELPEGFCLCPTGGRPPKKARDTAVFMARAWLTSHCGMHTKKADEWILKKFDFSERSEIRRAIRNADSYFSFKKGRWMLMVLGKGVFYLPCGIHAPAPGNEGWAWCAEMENALPVVVSNLSIKWGVRLQNV